MLKIINYKSQRNVALKNHNTSIFDSFYALLSEGHFLSKISNH